MQIQYRIDRRKVGSFPIIRRWKRAVFTSECGSFIMGSSGSRWFQNAHFFWVCLRACVLYMIFHSSDAWPTCQSGYRLFPLSISVRHCVLLSMSFKIVLGKKRKKPFFGCCCCGGVCLQHKQMCNREISMLPFTFYLQVGPINLQNSNLKCG